LPNWMTHRVNVTGPASELQRLVKTCIRVPQDDDEVTLDFAALRPMPDVVRATGEDGSETARERARTATGYHGWYDWSLANWGTKWNSSAFQELLREQERYACVFDTAWSCPEPIFREIALSFPLLTVRVFSVEEGCGFGAVSDMRDGSYTAADVAVSRKLRHLVHSADPFIGFPEVSEFPPNLAPFVKGTGLAAKVFGIRDAEQATQVVERAWRSAYADLTQEQFARLCFAEDVYGYLEWLDLTCGDIAALSWDEAQEALEGYVESDVNLRFFTEQSRCATSVDRWLLDSVASRINPRAERQHEGATSATDSSSPHTEDEMREWALYAIARGSRVDMSDATALFGSVAAAEERLYLEAVAHVRGASCAMSDGPKQQVA
jgi:hypothetical protein